MAESDPSPETVKCEKCGKEISLKDVEKISKVLGDSYQIVLKKVNNS